MNVGERIKIRRKELGYNADYLAKHLGVSRSTIFRYEKGEIVVGFVLVFRDFLDWQFGKVFYR